MSLVISKAILLALAPMVHQETFWSNVGFRQADDCPYFNSCFDKPYGDGKWNGNLSNTSSLGTEFTSGVSGNQTLTDNLLSSFLAQDLYGKTEGSMMYGGIFTKQTSITFVNSHRPHRPSGNACDNPGQGRPPFCNPEPEYPSPIPLPAPIAFLLTALMGLGVFKMFKNIDDLENIR